MEATKEIFNQIYKTLSHITQLNVRSPVAIQKYMMDLKKKIDALPKDDLPGADLAESEKEFLGEAPLVRPIIICLCGSTRFMDAFFEQGWEETLKGKIVLSVGVCKHAEDHGGEALGPEVAELLDELHLRKIDLADEVLILNVGGYIGESTGRELAYAQKHNKKIRFLEPRD